MKASVVVALLLVACGDDSATPQDGPSADRPADAPVADAGPDATPSDAAPPAGMRLAPGEGFHLWAVTSDNFAIYSDAGSMLWAQPLAGGTGTPLTTLGSSPTILARGKVVFVWQGTSPMASLDVWSAASGYQRADLRSLVGIAAASADGAHVVFTANEVNGRYDLIGATTDLTQQTALVTAANLTSCAPVPGFLTNSTAVVAYCPMAATTARIDTFAVASWTSTNQLSNLARPPWWSADAAGTLVFSGLATGPGIVRQLGGNTGQLDTSVTAGFLTASGQNVIYQNAQSLRRAAISSLTPSTLVTSGIGGLLAPAPDQTKVLFYGTRTNGTSDLLLASTTTAGQPTILRVTTDAALFGDAFTADSSHALYFTGVDSSTPGGALTTCTLGCTTPVLIATNAVIAFATSGTTVVYDDGYDLATGRADIKRVDVAQTPLARTLLVANVDASFLLTSARDHIVYTYGHDPATAGLYVLALP